MKRIMVLVLCAALLAGCGQRGESASAGATTTSTSVSTTTTTTTTAAGETADLPFAPEALYTEVWRNWNDQYFWMHGTENGKSVNAIYDHTGSQLCAFTTWAEHDVVSTLDLVDEVGYEPPVRFLVGGYIYDGEGNQLPTGFSYYSRMMLQVEDGELFIRAECEVGCFLFDLDGKMVKKVDTVQVKDELFGGRLVQTVCEQFRFTQYGVRDQSFRVILPELYQRVYPLSADRIVGSGTKWVLSVGDPDTSAVIVDGEGNVICDRYNDISFTQQADGTYYPYGLAWRSNPEAWGQEGVVVGAKTPDCYYYVIDWNGESQFEEEIVAYTGEGVVVLTFGDGETVRFSLLTGEVLSK